MADPLRPGRVAASLEVSEGAVATSGTAERGQHLWDGRTGRRADSLASVTVIGPHLTWAVAFATVAFVLGPDGLTWVEQFEGYGALAVDHDGRLHSTAGVRLLAAAA